MNLYTGLPYKDRLGNDIYPDYRNMLRIEELLASQDIPEIAKPMAALQLFYGSDIPADVQTAFSELLWFYYRGEEPEAPKGRVNPIFDFEEDAPLILAAFHSSYGVDLTDTGMHIHWWLFMSLFIALPENTQMMKRMQDRNVDISKLKGDERKWWLAHKKAIALKGKKKPAVTPADRRQAKQQRIDELYAEAERRLAEKTEAEV